MKKRQRGQPSKGVAAATTTVRIPKYLKTRIKAIMKQRKLKPIYRVIETGINLIPNSK